MELRSSEVELLKSETELRVGLELASSFELCKFDMELALCRLDVEPLRSETEPLKLLLEALRSEFEALKSELEPLRSKRLLDLSTPRAPLLFW